MSLSKTDAVRMAQRGDAAAFEYLYRLHSRRVYAICLRMVRGNTEAEDLTQEVFLQSFRDIQSARDESSFSTALLRLTVDIVLRRRASRNNVSTSDVLVLDLAR